MNEVPHVKEKTPLTALDAGKHLFLIAEIQAKKGMKEEALATVKLGEELFSAVDKKDFKYGADQEKTFRNKYRDELICAYAGIGEIQEAEKKASTIVDDKERAEVIGRLVDYKAKNGDIQGAMDLAKQSDDLIQSLMRIAGIQLEANDREGASKTKEEVIGKIVDLEKADPSKARYEYPDLFDILIRLDDMKAALFYYEKLDLSRLNIPIVEGLAFKGEIEKAMEIARGVRGMPDFNDLLLKIALVCARTGKLELAINLYEETDKDKWIQSWVARMLVAAGEFERAKEEIATWVDRPTIPLSVYRAEVARKIKMLPEMVKEQVKRGKIDDALQTIDEMKVFVEKELSTKIELPELFIVYEENLAEAYLALAGFGEE